MRLPLIHPRPWKKEMSRMDADGRDKWRRSVDIVRDEPAKWVFAGWSAWFKDGNLKDAFAGCNYLHGMIEFAEIIASNFELTCGRIDSKYHLHTKPQTRRQEYFPVLALYTIMKPTISRGFNYNISYRCMLSNKTLSKTYTLFHYKM